MEIQLALQTKDGMVNHVLIWLAHQDLGIMEKNVFVLTLMIDVFLGNYLMGINVYTINTLALLEHHGMENCVPLPQMIVHKDFIKMELNVNHFLKDVFTLQFGRMIVVSLQMDLVLMEL